ncbi:MAG: DegQ family serine endoprotease, partial [Nitrospirota bacterium]
YFMKVFDCLTAGSGSFFQTGWVRIGTLGIFLIAFVQCSQGSGDAGAIAQATVSAAEPTESGPVARVSTVGLPSNDTFVRVSKEAMASVVNISSTRKVEQSQQSPFFDDPFFRRFFGEEFERRFRQPQERQEQGLGSGVIIGSDGYIVTNNHVVEQADELQVMLADKRKYPAKLIGTDPKTDLAVIKIEASDLPTLPWGDSNSLQVGEMVLAVGNPFGLNQTVTMGIISAVGRANMGIVDYENFIQTDAAINPGNSGGALVNLNGELIGINTAIFSRTGGYMGIGFAIPSQMVKHVMQSLISHGKVVRGWLGVSIQEVTPDLATQFDAPDTTGVLVGDVFDDSPAKGAGVRRGDIIREFQGTSVKDPNHLRALVADTPPNSTARMTVWREGGEKELQVSIGEMPRDLASLSSETEGKTQGDHALAGITVGPIPPEQGTDQKGVVITHIEADSPAARAGLREGDILVELNRQEVRTIEDFQRLTSNLEAKSPVLVLLKRGRGTIFLAIKP